METQNETNANEEKAREICHCSECTYKMKSEGDNCMCPRMAAILQAMNWKDEQEIEFLQSLLFQASTQQSLNVIINNRIKLLKGE